MGTGAELSHTWVDKERAATEFADCMQKDIYGQAFDQQMCFNNPDVRAYGIALYCDLAAGYAAVLPLEEREVELLPTLVRTRVATRIVGGEWRAARFPENREYLARNVERLWEVFACLPERPTDADARRLEEIGGAR